VHAGMGVGDYPDRGDRADTAGHRGGLLGQQHRRILVGDRLRPQHVGVQRREFRHQSPLARRRDAGHHDQRRDTDGDAQGGQGGPHLAGTDAQQPETEQIGRAGPGRDGRGGVSCGGDDFTTSLLEEALQLQHLIDDLQDLAAADVGVLRLHREDVYVRDLLHQVATAHRAAADSAGVTLTVRTDDDPKLYADPVRIRQMIGNLVSNAVRHTAALGSVELRAVGADSEVSIEVRDTGHGIEPEELPYVFDRFWRAEKSRSRSTGGSGLGLAIVRQLTQAHDGTVTVHSTPGAGTVFGVTLPVVRADRQRS